MTGPSSNDLPDALSASLDAAIRRNRAVENGEDPDAATTGENDEKHIESTDGSGETEEAADDVNGDGGANVADDETHGTDEEAVAADGDDEAAEKSEMNNGDDSSDGTEEEAEDDEDEEDDDEEEEDDDEEEDEEEQMTLRDHLVELRKRVTRAFLCSLLGFFACYPFAEDIYGLLLTPLIAVMPPNSMLIYTAIPEAFFTYLKVAFFAGMFVSSPLIFYQIWAFVAPGLYKEEKVYIIPIACMSGLCFVAGGAFCFFMVFPIAFEFFMSYNVGRIQAMPSLHEYLSFILQLIFAFGLVFEMPLFVFFLARLGLVTAAWLRKVRRYAILVTFIVAAILTPPDVLSQLLMAGPMLLLYELSIGIAAVFGRKPLLGGTDDDDATESGDTNTTEDTTEDTADK